jgi:hypothetical protein
MMRGFALSLLISALIMIGSPILCLADPDLVWLAQANVEAAWIHGGAIVIAGLAIGIGIYFGLRSRSR